MTVQDIGEFGLIKLIDQQLRLQPDVVKGIGDDTAVLPLNKKEYLLLTTDMMAQDVHFTLKMPPEAIGHKALAVNISDIASMGGVPTYAVVSIGMPGKIEARFVKAIYKGMQVLAHQFKVSIVGGDTISANQLVINVTLLGKVEKKHLVTRDGAKTGDSILVTGALGGSFKSGRHLTFMPRVEQARFLVKHFKPSAMMDISDGLAGDLNHILLASKKGAVINETYIPKHQGVSIKQALSEGEDFELLFTLSPEKTRSLLKWQEQHKQWFFYPIGTITGNPKQLLAAKAYDHFRS